MGQIPDHPRNLASYVHHDKGLEVRCGQNQESQRTAAPYAHSEVGSKHLIKLRSVLGLISALIVLWIQQSCTRPGNVTIQNCYRCTVGEVLNK